MPTGRSSAARIAARRLPRLLAVYVALVAASTMLSAAVPSATWRWAISVVSIAAALTFATVALFALRRMEVRPLEALTTAAHAVQSSGAHTPGAVEPPVGEMERSLRDSMEATGDVETAAREAVEQGTILAVQMRSELTRDLGDYPAGWTVAAGLRPAEGVVAGDCYDVGLLSDRTIGLVVLDIAGHGALTAVSALRCKDLLKAGLRSGMAPGQAFGWLLAQDHGLAGTFLTGFVAVIDVESGLVRYASAGHPEALLREGQLVTALPPTGPIVGPVATEWRTEQVTVPVGGVLVVYTDGLIEARDDARQFYGFDRLRDVVRDLECREAQPFVARVLGDLDSFQPFRVADDVTLVVACRTPADGAIADRSDRERGRQ
jgi:sigma-B regulation protein RsbU (phosphoserine phosphatase)